MCKCRSLRARDKFICMGGQMNDIKNRLMASRDWILFADGFV